MTITPPVGGNEDNVAPFFTWARAHRYVLLFAVGAVSASAVLGFALGLLGAALGRPAIAWLITIGCCAVIIFCRLTRVPLLAPTRKWLVPRHLQALGRDRWSLLFGITLGLGFLTIVSSGAYYVLAFGVLALANPPMGALVFGAFGVGRAIPLFVAAGCVRRQPGRYDPHTPKLCLEKLIKYRRWLRLAALTVTALIGAAVCRTLVDLTF
ncbi:MAG: hypothetical protein MJB57_18035 [Gemmatimonadetes bacterium]|nr:hypothetical protein [Gemmatimonadota bacterium]